MRDAIDGACGPLYPRLPLLTATFTDFDVAQALGEPGAIVVAEEVVRVPSTGRPPFNRVDFFCYKENGDVVRYHPGQHKKQDMKPHCMSIGSPCFRMADAAQQGVGKSLHAHPPGAAQPGSTQPGAAQPGDPLVHLLATRQDLDLLCIYDIQSLSWRVVREELHVLPLHDHTVDCSDGSRFPWWVWIANTGLLRDVVNDGVIGVDLEVADGKKSIVAHSVRGDFRLSKHPETGEKVIRPKPPRYDP
jgi:hypothetical protein